MIYARGRARSTLLVKAEKPVIFGLTIGQIIGVAIVFAVLAFMCLISS